MSGAPQQVRGILFDVDGTLVDSTYIHALCWWQALREQDVDAPMAVIHRAVGMGSDKLVDHVLGAGHGLQVPVLAASHDALYAAYWPRLRPLPGARELLRRCHDAGLSTVLASSAKERELAVLQRVLDCDEAIDLATSSADAQASKPAPDIVAVALERCGLAPEQALFVGDAVWDVQASVQLGLRCVGLECGGTSAAELLAAGASGVYTDPAEFLAHVREWIG